MQKACRSRPLIRPRQVTGWRAIRESGISPPMSADTAEHGVYLADLDGLRMRGGPGTRAVSRLLFAHLTWLVGSGDVNIVGRFEMHPHAEPTKSVCLDMFSCRVFNWQSVSMSVGDLRPPITRGSTVGLSPSESAHGPVLPLLHTSRQSDGGFIYLYSIGCSSPPSLVLIMHRRAPLQPASQPVQRHRAAMFVVSAVPIYLFSSFLQSGRRGVSW
ncbi:hypothetical protein P170DRAFT_269292 [Aspergillus steynii IBT 23096]|uniref:Uncharacterized protein n=1 Tax=Aspergillus steynii IBT 23096 TaxID=1392250 RepID=A0A2I2FW45_9EURO|nr:uncharacterized protein P170DRAFT_269292 [Aspergillus steynii IBT 23096]PLB44873.1 hypothetical protein P170DRAFT_269292 [Aspergillus steynii IBT 23096]